MSKRNCKHNDSSKLYQEGDSIQKKKHSVNSRLIWYENWQQRHPMDIKVVVEVYVVMGYSLFIAKISTKFLLTILTIEHIANWGIQDQIWLKNAFANNFFIAERQFFQFCHNFIHDVCIYLYVFGHNKRFYGRHKSQLGTTFVL